MTSTGTRMGSDSEIIAKLKREIEIHVATLKSSDAWVQFHELYQALGTVEQIAGVRRTSLEEVFGLGGTIEPSPSAKPAGKGSELVLGEPQEPESIAEIERGA